MVPSGKKTALVLSAGGLYCAWQAGAWKAIAGPAPPDMVLGASAGALNGWPIAGGCPPDTLIERWLDRRCSDVLHLIPEPGWKHGYFDPKPLLAQCEQIVDEFQPLIPFGLTMVALPRFRSVLVRHPEVTASHLLATCSIPLLMPPVAIHGVKYVDGGLIEKAPVRGALEMGASRLIVLDCLPPLDIWWLRLGAGAVRVFTPRTRIPPAVDTLVIRPSEPLGETNSAIFWKRENIERWIDLGFRDASKALQDAAGAHRERERITAAHADIE